DQDLLQSPQVTLGVQAIASRTAPARFQQADLVVVVQGPHRDVRQPGCLADGVVGTGAPRLLTGLTLVHLAYSAASRCVRVKLLARALASQAADAERARRVGGAFGCLDLADISFRILVDRPHPGEVARLEVGEGYRQLVPQLKADSPAEVTEALALLL